MTSRGRGLLLLGFGPIVFAAALATVGTAATSKITVKPLGTFKAENTVGYPSGHTFKARIVPGSSVATYVVRFGPGDEYPFHHHGSAVVATVARGTLTVQDAATCKTQSFRAGQGFVEEPNVTHRAINRGRVPVTLYVTYLGVPGGKMEDTLKPSTFDPC